MEGHHQHKVEGHQARRGRGTECHPSTIRETRTMGSSTINAGGVQAKGHRGRTAAQNSTKAARCAACGPQSADWPQSLIHTASSRPPCLELPTSLSSYSSLLSSSSSQLGQWTALVPTTLPWPYSGLSCERAAYALRPLMTDSSASIMSGFLDWTWQVFRMVLCFHPIVRGDRHCAEFFRERHVG